MSPSRVLVVCHANVARSVAAAYLLTGALDERGVDVEVATAGTHATEGQPVSSRTETSLAAAIGAPVSARARTARTSSWTTTSNAPTSSSRWRPPRCARCDARTPAPPARSRPSVCSRAELPEDGGASAARVAAMALADRDPDDQDDVADPAGGDDAAYDATMAVARRALRSSSRAASAAEHAGGGRATYDPAVEVADSVIELIGNTPLVRLHNASTAARAPRSSRRSST